MVRSASYSDVDGWNARAALNRNGILAGAGLEPFLEKTPLHPITLQRRAMDGYSVQNVAIENLPGFFLTGNLYRPGTFSPDGEFPAILVVHGHGDPVAAPRFSDDYQTLCQNLARLGFVVFVHDMVGYGESTQLKHKTDTTLGLQLWNNIRAMDFLTGLPGVDAKRIGVTGHSGGGTQTILLTAVDDRVAASAPVTMVAAHFFGGCQCESGVPIHRRSEYETNNAEIAALAAPRPQMIVSVGGDWTNNTPRVEFPYIRDVYCLFDADAPAVGNAHFEDEGHNYGPSKRAAVYRFFATTFLEPVTDEEIELMEDRARQEPMSSLRVFTDDHPRPELAANGPESIRRQWPRAIAE